MSDTFSVSECFSTYQGEGPSIGQPATFVRLGYCNLHCSWCDADYSWAFTPHHTGLTGRVFDPHDELFRVTPHELAAKIADLDGRVAIQPMLVMTGGEPMLQQRLFARLFRLLGPRRIEIETNGTIAPITSPGGDFNYQSGGDIHFNVSPKLANSGNDFKSRIKEDALHALLAYDSIFKFVVGSRSDLDEVLTIVDAINIPARRVWIMPLGVETSRLNLTASSVAAFALAYGWNLTMRMQIALWGNERGR